MKRLLTVLAVIAGAMPLWCPPVAAQDTTAWVTDRLEVTLRRGTGTQYAIVAMLPSGQRVQVLERDAGEGYSRVRTEGGAEGWVLTRYLEAQPAARERLAETEERLRQTLAQRGAEGEMLDAMTAERDALDARVAELESSEANLRRELAELREAAGDTLAVHERNRALDARTQELEERIAELTLSNRDMARQVQRDWFVAGAGVLLLGVVLGVVLPRIRWRRRSRWGDL